ncbi:uncharacterized protein LAESUDRAFT_418721 [Laetiporus sulphureus 93-53]|uniref:Aminotransferase class I/classII domain-containing protein n=1 Tax=Laetiporus sulphureus 93-53 TaxID=1314785 RepID=A0A165GFU5_9APHY|nr:uncharacterized protein LAESUDRAFT_418721 [Laetiporus sulphureus 93-53]KZT10289.1 hypothetical protein LAESUDRAFT_418721 [Laetiporus sulphureus 93-53]
MQTLSKSFGLAAIRESLERPHSCKITHDDCQPGHGPRASGTRTDSYEYTTLSVPTASLALSALSRSVVAAMNAKVVALVEQCAVLLHELEKLRPLGLGDAIGGNDANFVMVPVSEIMRAPKGYTRLRRRKRALRCEGCLRITVGSAEENVVALRKLEQLLKEL